MENVNLKRFQDLIRTAQDNILQAREMLKYLEDNEEGDVQDKLDAALEFTEDALEDAIQANSK